MIPSVLATQMQRGVQEFLRATFPVTSPGMDGLLDGVVDANGGMFKGPYLSLKLPFKQTVLPPGLLEHATPKYAPYAHQVRAFERLTGTSPQSTLVATGTGSGKTECFLY